MKEERIKETKTKAAHCTQNYICQTENGAPYCKITSTVGGSVFFTETRHPSGCFYQHSFGRTYICTCPVRQEIYKKTNC